MENILIALIGVGGTLLGTLIGWILNSQSYRVGKTKIYGTLVTTVKIPPASMTGGVTKAKCTGPEYSINCVATNSRQIPVILESFYLKCKLTAIQNRYGYQSMNLRMTVVLWRMGSRFRHKSHCGDSIFSPAHCMSFP